MSDTQTRVIKILDDHLGCDLAESDDPGSAKLIDDLSADSMDVVIIVMAIEDEFEVTITDEEGDALANGKTVADLCDLIDEKQKAAA